MSETNLIMRIYFLTKVPRILRQRLKYEISFLYARIEYTLPDMI